VTETATRSSTSRRVLFILALLALVVLGLWLALRGTKPKPAARGPTHKVTVGAAPRFAPMKKFDPRVLPHPSVGEPEPIIDEVILEKKEVCEGEENLVTVRAHTPNGTDSFLHYTVGEGTGAQTVLRTFSAGREKGNPRFVMVFGRNNVVTTVPLPEFTLKSCQQDRIVEIRHRLMPNSVGHFELWAEVRDFGVKSQRDAPPFQAKSYVWTFGDETSETTTVPRVVHSYEERPQETLYSTFLVTVTITGADGTKLVGRRSLQLMNPVFEELWRNGAVRLLVALDPPFPELNTSSRTVEHTARVWHLREEPVTLTKVVATTNYFPRQAAVEKETVAETLQPAAFAGTTVIPPGRGIEFRVSKSAKDGPDWHSVEYVLHGTSAEGWPAIGNFALMMPPPEPTRERHQPITDPLKVAKILKARELLGKEFVTDEDLFRLQREGKFEGLKPDPNLKITKLREPDLPKPKDGIKE
jgi:hypothetical protein